MKREDKGTTKRAATIELTKLIKRIGGELHTIDDDGNALTKVEALARIVWEKALGRTVETPTADGIKTTVIPPDRVYIGMIWDRIEGKVVPVAKDTGKEKATLSERVADQSKRRLNQMSKEKSDG